MAEHISVTIARQYGSGGREVGEKLADMLGFRYVDREFITLAAQKSGYDKDIIDRVDERASKSILYTLAMGSLYGVPHVGYTPEIPINDKLFLIQSDLIRSLSEEGSCVFVGRCADYVLREDKRRVSLFLYAPMETRVARVCERYGATEDEARELIVKTDKKRMNYYNFYSGKKWGKFDNYHLSMDVSVLGIEKSAAFLADYINTIKQGET